jgi:hypothetical protein
MSFVFGVLVLIFQVRLGAQEVLDDVAPTPKTAPKIVHLSGPHSHANLSIFLIHGEANLKERKFLSLGEAMEQQKIIVHETSEVNTLMVESLSEDSEVFIQSGDIVKGGKQDRLMATDMIVPAKSGRIPIPSFCVESGRWTGRGQEDVARFSANAFQGGKSVKLAANHARSQQEVWSKVQEAQSKLSKTVNKDVAAPNSPTSYQLTREDKELVAKLDEYETKLACILQSNDVIGIAYAINGVVEGVEIYGSAPLLKSQWKKLLNSCATDALAALDAVKERATPGIAAVETFLRQSEGTLKELKQAVPGREALNVSQNRTFNLPQTANQVSREPQVEQTGQHLQQRQSEPQQQVQQSQPAQRVAEPVQETQTALAFQTIRIFQCETPTTLLIESRDMDGNGNLIHRSYLRKEK